MAEYFAQHGWQDITIAFPVNVREIEAINRLAERVRLHLLVESEESVRFLQHHLSCRVNVWIKIDTGSYRTGLSWINIQGIAALAHAILLSDTLNLRGLLTHAGQTYSARSQDRVLELYQESVARMKSVQDYVQVQEKIPLEISIGDTPGCSVVEQFDEVDEIRPGNFIFYDVMQFVIGSCSEGRYCASGCVPGRC